MGWKCIAIHWFVLQVGRLDWPSVSQYTGVYCDIVAGREEFVLQRRGLRLYRNTIGVL